MRIAAWWNTTVAPVDRPRRQSVWLADVAFDDPERGRWPSRRGRSPVVRAKNCRSTTISGTPASHQRIGDVGADQPCAAGDQNPLVGQHATFLSHTLPQARAPGCRRRWSGRARLWSRRSRRRRWRPRRSRYRRESSTRADRRPAADDGRARRSSRVAGLQFAVGGHRPRVEIVDERDAVADEDSDPRFGRLRR